MEDKPVYLVEQNDGILTVEDPPLALDGGRLVYCYQPPTGPAWPVDQALSVDLETLRGVADMAGAAQMVILRRVEAPDIYFRRGGDFGQLRGADAGLLVLIRFDVDDGELAACQQWEFR